MSVPAFIAVALVATACVMACPHAVASDEDNNLPSSVRRVERETGGRVLSAERRHQSGREVNRIKVFTPEGRVRVMWDEPRHAAPPAARSDASPEPRAQRSRDPRPVPSRPVPSREDRR